MQSSSRCIKDDKPQLTLVLKLEKVKKLFDWMEDNHKEKPSRSTLL
jgi:hypothetical protein